MNEIKGFYYYLVEENTERIHLYETLWSTPTYKGLEVNEVEG